MMPTLALVMATEVVIATTSGAISDDKLGITTNLGYNRAELNPVHKSLDVLHVMVLFWLSFNCHFIVAFINKTRQLLNPNPDISTIIRITHFNVLWTDFTDTTFYYFRPILVVLHGQCYAVDDLMTQGTQESTVTVTNFLCMIGSQHQ